MNIEKVMPSALKLRFHDRLPALDEIYRQRYVGGMIQEMLVYRYHRGSLTKQELSFWAEKVVDSEKYPQYKGHYSGDEWEIEEVKQEVFTKMGPAFYFGDVTLVKREGSVGFSHVTAFSFRNGVDTAI